MTVTLTGNSWSQAQMSACTRSGRPPTKSAPASAACVASSGECTPQIFTRGAMQPTAAMVLKRLVACRVVLQEWCGRVHEKTPGAPPQRLDNAPRLRESCWTAETGFTLRLDSRSHELQKRQPLTADCIC